MGKGAAAVLVLSALVVGDAPARAFTSPPDREPSPARAQLGDAQAADPPLDPPMIHPCCLRSSEYRARTQFVTAMLRSVEDL